MPVAGDDNVGAFILGVVGGQTVYSTGAAVGVCSDSEWHIYTFLLTLNAIITCWSSFVALRKIVG